jgi:hypothetical protein
MQAAWFNGGSMVMTRCEKEEALKAKWWAFHLLYRAGVTPHYRTAARAIFLPLLPLLLLPLPSPVILRHRYTTSVSISTFYLSPYNNGSRVRTKVV